MMVKLVECLEMANKNCMMQLFSYFSDQIGLYFSAD